MDDVRFSPDYVCLALNSGRSGGIAECPFLTQLGHYGFLFGATEIGRRLGIGRASVCRIIGAA